MFDDEIHIFHHLIDDNVITVDLCLILSFSQLSWSQECTLWWKHWSTSEEQINKVAGDVIYSVLDYM